jgi:hypothetical protein
LMVLRYFDAVWSFRVRHDFGYFQGSASSGDFVLGSYESHGATPAKSLQKTALPRVDLASGAPMRRLPAETPLRYGIRIENGV